MAKAQKQRANSVDPAEVEQFSRIADEWWNESGKFAPLHRMNPCRIEYIVDIVMNNRREKESKSYTSLKGISLLDIGCGGGLIAEPMARLGAKVTAIDASERNIEVAKLHAEKSSLKINYKNTTAEDMADNKTRFDVVLALEIIEHVNNPAEFIASCCKLLTPDGIIIMSTINRTMKAYGMAIIGAEYIMRWLPIGTHNYNKFIKPSEMARAIENTDTKVIDSKGMIFNPLNKKWSLSDNDLSVNYLMCGQKK